MKSIEWIVATTMLSGCLVDGAKPPAAMAIKTGYVLLLYLCFITIGNAVFKQKGNCPYLTAASKGGHFVYFLDRSC